MLTGEVLCTGSVKSIEALVKECDFLQDQVEDEKVFFLAERLPQHAIVNGQERQHLLRFAYLPEVTDIDGYTSGRIFREDFELRWEKDNDGSYWVVYLGAKQEISGLEERKEDREELEKLERVGESKHYYLFGDRLDPDDLKQMGLEPSERYYAEVRIPRLLHYPAPPGARRVQLTVCEYTYQDTGQVRLFRFQNLIEAE